MCQSDISVKKRRWNRMKVKVDARRAGAGASGKRSIASSWSCRIEIRLGIDLKQNTRGFSRTSSACILSVTSQTAYRTIHGASSRARQEANSPSYTQAGTCPNMRYAHLLRMPCICRTSSQRLRRLNDVQMFLLLQCRPGNGS